jgi:DNA-binding PadR family transcriptional regulator
MEPLTNDKQINVRELSTAFKDEIVQRITRNLLDIQLLRLIQNQPMWGYMLKKTAETKFGVKLRHGALYPLLNALEKEGFIISNPQAQGGRIRKVYTITRKGEAYVRSYAAVLEDQLKRKDLE